MTVLSPPHPGSATSITTDLPLRGSLFRSKEESSICEGNISKGEWCLRKVHVILEKGYYPLVLHTAGGLRPWLSDQKKAEQNEILKRDILLVEAKTNTETPYLPPPPAPHTDSAETGVWAEPTQAPAAWLGALATPPSHWWCRGTVPSCKVLSAPGHSERWQISWQGQELRETGENLEHVWGGDAAHQHLKYYPGFWSCLSKDKV